VIGLLLSFAAHPVAAQTTSPTASSFTYQGRLLTSGQPFSGSCAFQFGLYDAASAGTQLGTTQTIEALTVKDGYFKATLDFGLTPFTGAVRFLDVSVKCASETTFTPLGRQPLTAAPQALIAQSVPWTGLTGLPANLTFLNSPTSCTNEQVAKWNGTAWACGDITVGTDTLAKLTCTSGQIAKWNGTAWECGSVAVGGTDTLASLTCAAGQVAKRNSANTAWECAADTDIDTNTTYTAGDGLTLTDTAFSVKFAASGGSNGTVSTAARSDHNNDATYWNTTGNASTTPGTNFIGTTDSQALEFKVNNTRALRLEPNVDSPNIIGGFSGNNVTSGVKGATIGGGGAADNLNFVTDDYGTVGGGYNNQAGDNAGTTDDKVYATVGGGYKNIASAFEATVGGGYQNIASGQYGSTVGGGYQNVASSNYATVGGGDNNKASGSWSMVGGGQNNAASGNRATVGGGDNNKASGSWSMVGGGYFNEASGDNATVGGGDNNKASGSWSMVSGGGGNEAAGEFSFAAGRRAKVGAAHGGTFLWADSNDADFASVAANEFAVRATGGVRFVTSADGAAGMKLAAGGSGWSTLSDRNAKANFVPVNSQEVLAKVAAMPLSTWNYKTQDAKIRHMGPMAQDLYQAFGLGEDEKHINTVDADGVALAAIQGLAQQNQAQQAEIAALKARLAVLEAQLNQK